ncbi:MAG: ERAP1-like C-terminal domain-containing protein, partial [Acidimicrobiales bacterium]
MRALLDSWIFQGGHPLVTARLEGDSMILTEQPFRYLNEGDRPEGGAPSAIGKDWLVPVRVEDRPGAVTAGLLGPPPNGSDPLHVVVGNGLPIANAGGSGTYRLRYEGPLFEQIASNLGRLEPLERFNLVSDTWASTLAGLSGIEDFLALVKRLGSEEDPNVWGVVQSAAGLLDFAAAGVADEQLSSLLKDLVTPELDRIGWEAGSGDTPEQQRTRSILVGLLGTIGADEKARSWARESFAKALSGDEPLPASLAQPILSTVVYSGGEADFEAVRERYRNPSDPLDEWRNLLALTATRDESLVLELLEMTRGEIRTQDAHLLLRTLLQSRAVGPIVWEFVKEHWAEYSRRLPSHAMPTVIGGVARLVQVDGDGRARFVEDVRRFVKEHPFGGHQK